MRTIIEERGGVLELRSIPLSREELTPMSTAPSWIRKAREKRERQEWRSRLIASALMKLAVWGSAFIIASGIGFLIGGVLRHVL